ncbi:MAG: hypothetical protein IJ404_05265 [Clostridia bacterium]|nr:hypothetical protein [Clostridia bacterium]
MKENEFLDGVSNIDSDIVERFVSMDNRLKRKASKRIIWVRVGALAASFALIASVVLSVISNIVPTWNTAHYSASDIAKLFPPSWGGETNAYEEVYVSDEKYLYINEMPDSEYLPIYKYAIQTKKVNEKEYKEFSGSVLPRLIDALGGVAPEYKRKDVNDGDEIYSFGNIGKYHFSIEQNETTSKVNFGDDNSNDGDSTVILDGETVQIDQRMSDEEILESLESVKNKLFDILGVSFKNAKVVRSFYSTDRISIYFYNEDAHPLNKYQDYPVSDEIHLLFDAPDADPDDPESSYIFTDVNIYYTKYRNDILKEYDHIANAKRISLKKAEELLYKGYVFGGHNCPICMKAQDKISFDGYDFVDIEYIYERFPDTSTDVIPFYAFYKKIEATRYGIIVYAKTYVPAIQISGYEEYFESQAANHR